MANKEEDFEYTKYEKARVLGARALQLSMGAPIAIDISKKKLEEIRFNVLEIAKMEYAAGKIPITVKRPEVKSK